MTIAIIIDIVIAAIVLLMAVLGIKRGFVKTIMGLASSILVLVIAIVAVSPMTNAIVDNTTWDDSLNSALEQPLADKLPNAYAKIYYYDLDGNGEKELIYEIDNVKDSYDNIMGSSLLKFVGSLIKPLIDDQVDIEDADSSVYFIDAITNTITGYVFLIAGFIVLCIAAKLVIYILLKLLQKAVSKMYIAHFLDKMLGGLFGLVIGALIVLVILTILQLLSSLSFMTVVNTALEQTTLVKFVMDHNFLYTFIAQKVDLTSLFSKITG